MYHKKALTTKGTVSFHDLTESFQQPETPRTKMGGNGGKHKNNLHMGEMWMFKKKKKKKTSPCWTAGERMES